MSATAPFVTQLRSRPGAVVIGHGQPTMTVRVQVTEVWDVVRVDAAPDTTVATVKARALEALLAEENVGAYVVKLRGVDVLDESVSLTDAGAVSGSTFLVTSRRRRPVR